MNLKTKLLGGALLAAAAFAGSAVGASAATIDHGTSIYFAHPGWGPHGWVTAGQWVDVGSCGGGYCWVHRPGKDGYVKASAIEFAPPPPPHYPHHWHHGPGFGYGGGWGPGYYGPGYGYGGPGFCAGGPGGAICVHP